MAEVGSGSASCIFVFCHHHPPNLLLSWYLKKKIATRPPSSSDQAISSDNPTSIPMAWIMPTCPPSSYLCRRPPSIFHIALSLRLTYDTLMEGNLITSSKTSVMYFMGLLSMDRLTGTLPLVGSSLSSLAGFDSLVGAEDPIYPHSVIADHHVPHSWMAMVENHRMIIFHTLGGFQKQH